jgi:hypothetical protein
MKKLGGSLLAIIVLLTCLPGCGLFSTTQSSGATGTPSPAAATKPKPAIVDVTASTSGQLDYYYAVLDINLKNDGSEGTVLVTATVSQGQGNKTLEVPVSLAKDSKQSMRLVFPLKWKGGEWAPTVKVEVP